MIVNTFIRQKVWQNDKNKEKIQLNQLSETISTKLLVHSTNSRTSWTEYYYRWTALKLYEETSISW